MGQGCVCCTRSPCKQTSVLPQMRNSGRKKTRAQALVVCFYIFVIAFLLMFILCRKRRVRTRDHRLSLLAWSLRDSEGSLLREKLEGSRARCHGADVQDSTSEERACRTGVGSVNTCSPEAEGQGRDWTRPLFSDGETCTAILVGSAVLCPLVSLLS